MSSKIEIFVGDVNDVEGHVFARYIDRAGMSVESSEREPVVLRGTLRGPYCDRAHTLPAEFAFRNLGPNQRGLAEAVVPDPCTWSHELPHLYQADVEARQGERVLAEYHGKIGLRRATRKND